MITLTLTTLLTLSVITNIIQHKFINRLLGKLYRIQEFTSKYYNDSKMNFINDTTKL